MVTVDMSVDSRSTDGRYLGRYSVDNWGWLGRCCTAMAVIVSTEVAVGRYRYQYTDTSSIFYRLPADTICRYIGQYSINMFFDTLSLSRSTFVYIAHRYIGRHIS